jgi:hypothetical protein
MASRFKIPGAESVSGPGNMRPVNALAVEDTSGLERGVQNLAAGVGRAADSMFAVSQKTIERQKLVDATAAEARWTKGSIDIVNEFSNDGDYATMPDRVKAKSKALYDEVVGMIRDPDAKEIFALQLDAKRAGLDDNIGDYANGLSQQADRASFVTSLDVNASLASDPSLDDASRAKVLNDTLQSIEIAQETGLITPLEAQEYKRLKIDGAREQLAINRVNLDIQIDPLRVRRDLGIASGMGGGDIASSAIAVSGGVLDIPLDVAREAAAALGDGALPSDPALAKAYLKDPEVNARYAAIVMTELADRYNGDLTAAVIAAAPGGGLAIADAWVKSGHNEAMLPDKVRQHYRKVMERMTPESDRPDLPVIAAPDVNLADIEVAVLDRFEKLQTAFGEQVPVISGFRDPDRNAQAGGAQRSQHIDRRALDLDVSKLSKEERVRFIEMASAMGFTGIGVYKNTVHLDTGPRRSWGPDHSSGSVPAWAADAIERHNAGAIIEVPPTPTGLNERYAGLSFDQRIKLDAAARAAGDQQRMDLKAGIQVAVDNAPAAIMNGGAYSSDLPTADDFVQAYGAADGIERYKSFSAAVEVAETAYGMRTMNANDIADVVEAAMPTSTGDMAAIEQKKFDAIQAAAAATLEARNKDPVSYTQQVFPNVKAAWADVSSPELLANAITVTAEAQRGLGIETPKLLPAAVADSAAKSFNNAELPEDERLGAIISLVSATTDDANQKLIFDQLVAAGVPSFAQGAFAAYERNDGTSAGLNLFRAVMVDPSKVATALPNDVTPKQIDQTILDAVFADNEVGNVIHQVEGGTADNAARAGLDATLLSRAAQWRLLDGSATNAEDAVKKATRDLYGDVRVVTGKGFGGGAGVKIVLPSDADSAPLMDGFNSLLPEVSAAVTANLNAAADPGMEPWRAKIYAQGRDNRVSTILDEGYFTGDARNGFVFIDPKTGQAIPDQNGDPLVFTQERVMQAAASTAADRAAAQALSTEADPLASVSMGVPIMESMQ